MSVTSMDEKKSKQHVLYFDVSVTVSYVCRARRKRCARSISVVTLLVKLLSCVQIINHPPCT